MEQKRKSDGAGEGGSVSVKKKQKASGGNKEDQKDDTTDSDTPLEKKTESDQGDSSVEKKTAGTEDCPMDDWKTFRFATFPLDRNQYPGSRPPIYYSHWLRKKFRPLVKGNYYAEFDTLIHATSMENAKKIFECGELQQQQVKDSSIVNPAIKFCKVNDGNKVGNKVEFNKSHPMFGTEVVWYGPNKQELVRNSENIIKRYGNVVFMMKSMYGLKGIVREPSDFNYYFVEIVDYDKQSACRILVTKRSYPELLKYDPYEKGGPWYIDDNGKHFHLTKITNSLGRYLPNTLEFMREEEESYKSIWLTNHAVFYSGCIDQRPNVSVSGSNNYGLDRLKLALGLLSSKIKFQNNPVLQQWCFVYGSEEILLTLNKEDEVEKETHRDNQCARNFDNWLEYHADMNAFRKSYIENLLTQHIEECFIVDTPMDWLYSKFPQHREFFLLILTEMIKEKLFHTFADKTGITDISENQNNFSEFDFEIPESPESGKAIHFWLQTESYHFANEYEYEEFDTLTLYSSLENVYEIFESGNLFLSETPEMSVISRKIAKQSWQQEHPLAETKLISYCPALRKKMETEDLPRGHDRNVAFAMKTLDGKEGIISGKDDTNFHYYFVEVVEKQGSCICRILVTKRQYSQLQVYDPYKKGGPWYVEDRKHFQLLKLKNLQGEMVCCSVEFFREEHNIEALVTSWFINHEVMYREYKDQESREGTLRLALGLLASKISHPDNFVLQNWFLQGIPEDTYMLLGETHGKIEGELSQIEDENQRNFPDYLSKQIAQLKARGQSVLSDEEMFHLYDELSKEVNFSNINMESFMNGILKVLRKQFFIKDVNLHTIYKKLLSLVKQDRLSLFLKKLESALQCHALHKVHKEVKSKPHWEHQGCSYYINHASTSENKEDCFVRHWLPGNYRNLLPDDYNASNINQYYTAFDVLIKSPDENNYSDQLRPILHLVDGPSIANIRSELYDDNLERIYHCSNHPLRNAEVFRYMADQKVNVDNVSERERKYGERTLAMRSIGGNEGIIREKNDFYYYLIEVMDFPDKSVCRILATYGNEYPGLLKIDPYSEGAPFYIQDVYTCKYLGMIRNFRGRKVRNEVEFFREVKDEGWQKTNWQRNHVQPCPVHKLEWFQSFCYPCYNSR